MASAFVCCPRLHLLVALPLFLGITVPLGGQPAIAQQADPPPAQEADAPFGDLLEGLEGTDEADKKTAGDGDETTASDVTKNGSRAASDLATSPLFLAQHAMGEAARLLAEDQLSAPTQSAQQQALDALDAFIEQSLAPSATQSPSEPQEGAQQRQADAPSGEGEGQSESDERQAETPGDPSDVAAEQPGQAPETPIDDVAGPLAQPMEKAVWGHLPERLRERLQATLPEEFLPAYDQAIRDYFTSLSEMSDDDDE